MMDQRNLLGAGVGISEPFLKRMKLGYVKIARSKVRMADKGTGMTRLGLSKHFTLRLDSIRTGFDVQVTSTWERGSYIKLQPMVSAPK